MQRMGFAIRACRINKGQTRIEDEIAWWLFDPIKVGVVYLRLDAVVSIAKPNVGSFVAPTSISKVKNEDLFF